MIQQKWLVQRRTIASVNTCYEQQITLTSPASASEKYLPLSLLIFKVAFSSSANNTCILQYLTCNQEDKLRKSFRLSSQRKKIKNKNKIIKLIAKYLSSLFLFPTCDLTTKAGMPPRPPLHLRRSLPKPFSGDHQLLAIRSCARS